jgi:hypothetical protein
MRAFVELRRIAISYDALQEQLEQLRRDTSGRFDEYDEKLDQIFKALHRLIAPPQSPKPPVGFRIRDEDDESKPRSIA